MAKVTGNLLAVNLRGKVGELVFKRGRGGVLYVSHSPHWTKRSRKSKRVKEQNARFKEAVTFAQQVLKDETQRTLYEEEARRKNKSIFNIAISTYMKKK